MIIIRSFKANDPPFLMAHKRNAQICDDNSDAVDHCRMEYVSFVKQYQLFESKHSFAENGKFCIDKKFENVTSSSCPENSTLWKSTRCPFRDTGVLSVLIELLSDLISYYHALNTNE